LLGLAALACLFNFLVPWNKSQSEKASHAKDERGPTQEKPSQKEEKGTDFFSDGGEVQSHWKIFTKFCSLCLHDASMTSLLALLLETTLLC